MPLASRSTFERGDPGLPKPPSMLPESMSGSTFVANRSERSSSPINSWAENRLLLLLLLLLPIWSLPRRTRGDAWLRPTRAPGEPGLSCEGRAIRVARPRLSGSGRVGLILFFLKPMPLFE